MLMNFILKKYVLEEKNVGKYFMELIQCGYFVVALLPIKVSAKISLACKLRLGSIDHARWNNYAF